MRPVLFIVIGILAAACSNPCKEAQPVVDAYLLTEISHPETYKPIRLELVGEGRIDKDFYRFDLDGPTRDSIDIFVFRQEFRHLSRYGDPIESTWCLYVTEDLNAVLCSSSDAEPREGIRWTRRER